MFSAMPKCSSTNSSFLDPIGQKIPPGPKEDKIIGALLLWLKYITPGYTSRYSLGTGGWGARWNFKIREESLFWRLTGLFQQYQRKQLTAAPAEQGRKAMGVIYICGSHWSWRNHDNCVYSPNLLDHTLSIWLGIQFRQHKKEKRRNNNYDWLGSTLRLFNRPGVAGAVL